MIKRQKEVREALNRVDRAPDLPQASINEYLISAIADLADLEWSYETASWEPRKDEP